MREHAQNQKIEQELLEHGKKEGASFQVIVLGASGGPREDNVTGLLVRAPQAEWRKGSVIAVDAGAHLASIIRLLEEDMPRSSAQRPEAGHIKVLDRGPFAGVRFPHISAKANGLYVFRELLHSVLITHPHLDHLSAIAINTPALEYGREAKAIVALPPTIEAIKNHIFNDWIWPNLSDEGHGVGFVTYRRLIEGGNPRLGSGEARGYINVCDGLATKCWGVSHGKCHRHVHSHSRQSGDSFGWNGADYNFGARRMSRISDDHGYFAAMSAQQGQNVGGYPPAVQHYVQMPPGQVTPGLPGGSQPASAVDPNHMFEPVSSSAFFIRNDETGHEVLIFGDIEPDSVSISPRNHIVWDDAAAKIAKGYLRAIFIECSYDDSVRDADLYGHLCPRHLIAELTFLGHCVIRERNKQLGDDAKGEAIDGTALPLGQAPPINMSQPPTPADLKRKRKRGVNGDLTTTPELGPVTFATPLPASPQLSTTHVGSRSVSGSRRRTSHGSSHFEGPIPRPASRGRSVQFQAPILGPGHLSTASTAHGHSPQPPAQKLPEPLKGLTVHLIHVKDTLMDGPSPGEIIIQQVQKLSTEAGLGAEFNVTSYGQSIWI